MSTRTIRRVAMVAGGLSQGGAEKQLVYMAGALRRRGVDVRCYCLTTGDFHERSLQALGITPVWIGQREAPPFRLMRLARLLREFCPDVVQAGHFFANLYAALGARACGALSVGAIRNDGAFELRENRRWGRVLLRLPDAIVANSSAGARYAETHGRRDRVFLLPNMIDLPQFDAAESDLDLGASDERPLAMGVGRLVRAKRFDLFLAALAVARKRVPSLHGVIVGDGPERDAIQREARRLNLDETAVRFVGRRADVPALLRRAHILVSSSDHEGFPNVHLEAMAARVPIVTTPAGDAAAVIVPDVTGFVVPFRDVDGLADRMALLAASPSTRRTMGQAGRKRVEETYRGDRLAEQLLAIYAQAGLRKRGRLDRDVPASGGEVSTVRVEAP